MLSTTQTTQIQPNNVATSATMILAPSSSWRCKERCRNPFLGMLPIQPIQPDQPIQPIQAQSSRPTRHRFSVGFEPTFCPSCHGVSGAHEPTWQADKGRLFHPSPLMEDLWRAFGSHESNRPCCQGLTLSTQLTTEPPSLFICHTLHTHLNTLVSDFLFPLTDSGDHRPDK